MYSTRSNTPDSHSNTGHRLIIALLVGLLSTAVMPAWGAPIQVTTAAATSGTECALADAIDTAHGSGSGLCPWDGVGDPVIQLEEEIYDTDGVLPFVIDQGVSLRISGVGGTYTATINRDATDPLNRFFSVQGTLELANLTLQGGSASAGGAIFVSGTGHLELGACQVIDNSATGAGGAIYLGSGSLEVRLSTFENNTAMFGGAIHYGYGVTGTIVMSGFVNNFAGKFGGAIYSYSGAQGDLDIENSTFSANEALLFGGAIYQYSGAVTVDMSTFKDNLAPNGGSSLYRGWNTQEALEIARSAITGRCYGNITSLGDNAIGHWSCLGPGEQTIPDLDLQLSDLVRNHGLLTPVHVPICRWDSETGECLSDLIEQYECVGLGESSENPVRDQRDYFPRKDLISGGISGEKCDIGAYESVCADLNNPTGIHQELLVHSYPNYTGESGRKILDNGACSRHDFDFPAESTGCEVNWAIDMPWLDIQRIVFIDDTCAENNNLDCLVDPEACAAQCEAADLPEGWEATADPARFEIDACNDTELPRYVLEYTHETEPTLLRHWDPLNPPVVCTGPYCS